MHLENCSTICRKQYPGESNRQERFAEHVLTEEKLSHYLSKTAFKEMTKASLSGQPISRSLAEQIAQAMKVWALEKGTTHYTHWFQPLTGATAEKHESFLEFSKDGRAISSLEGTQLVQQEPDASSFPSGGIRNTFEARGYTAGPYISSLCFWKNTLYSTVFVSYTGEALDYKTPLLRSISAIDQAATECANTSIKTFKGISTLGWEQEYFYWIRA